MLPISEGFCKEAALELPAPPACSIARSLPGVLKDLPSIGVEHSVLMPMYCNSLPTRMQTAELTTVYGDRVLCAPKEIG